MSSAPPSAPLSERLRDAARVVIATLGMRHRVLPHWAFTYAMATLDRLSKGAVDLVRKLEAGTWRPRAPSLTRRQAAITPRPPRPAPEIPFPGFFGIVRDLIGPARCPLFVHGPSLHELLLDPALPG